jgi:PAS domain S-box-containing protein
MLMPAHTPLRRYIGRMVTTGASRPALWRYGIAVVLPGVALALTASLFSFDHQPFLVFFVLAVIFAALTGGRSSGIAATTVSVLLMLLALPPRISLRVFDAESLVRVVAFFAAGVVLSVLIGTIGDLQRTLDVERERMYRTVASIGDCVITTDKKGRVTFLNRVAEEATGWTLSEASGKPLEEIFRIINEKTRKTVPDPVRKVIETGRVVGLANHTLLVRRDGTEIPIEDSAAPIRDLQGHIAGVVLVFRDVTHERQTQAALIRAEKLASVGRLAASISHEVNNPLAAVSNLLYLIGTAPDLLTARSYAETAQSELARASYVTKQTLSFARRDEQRAPVQLSELIDGVLALYSNKLRGNAIQVVSRNRDHAMARANSNETKQVIANLIANALDASKKGGKLYLRVTRSNWNGNPRVRLTVADTGTGIPTEHMREIFEPFFSTKGNTGTGLGLWVIREIVDAHGGCIHMRSRVGKGTVVIVCWPAMAADHAEVA